MRRSLSIAIVSLGLAAPVLAQDGDITKRSVDDLVKDLAGTDEVRRTIAESELPRRGKAAVPPLCSTLQRADASSESRQSAARALRKLKDPSAIQALAQVYKDAKAPLAVRGESALALGDIGAVEAVPDLIEGLADNMFKVSETARQALVRIGTSAVPPLLDAYGKELQAKEPRDGVLFRSLLILGEIGGEKARDALLAALKTNTGTRAVGIRHHAALGLGIQQDKKAIDGVLEAYVAEKDFRVAQALVRTLEWLTGEHNVPPQPYRWKAWWTVNRDKILGVVDRQPEDVTLPKDGLKKGDPLEAPPAKPKDQPPK